MTKAAYFSLFGACALAFSAAAISAEDNLPTLAADARALSQQSIKAAQRDTSTVLSRIEKIAQYDKTVYAGNHVGLLQGNAVLMHHSGVPLLMRSCQMAVEARPGSHVQKNFLEICIGSLKTARAFGIAPVDEDALDKIDLRMRIIRAAQSQQP